MAQAVATPIARVPFLIGDHVATIAAGAAVPLRERHIGAAGVVGLEDPAHELEEVEQPTRPEAHSIAWRPSPSQSCSPLTWGCVVSLDSPAGFGLRAMTR